MLSKKAKTALFDIHNNILAARRFTANISFDEFKRSDLHFYAVVRALEIVSEASRRLPDEIRDRHPTLPWKQIMGIGNIFRHNYDTVIDSIVWATVHDFLDDLMVAVASEIAASHP